MRVWLPLVMALTAAWSSWRTTRGAADLLLFGSGRCGVGKQHSAPVRKVSSSGSGFFAQQPGLCWSVRRWCHVDHVRPDGGEVLSCTGFCSVPGPLQTAQKAEFWGVILALQSSGAVHLGLTVRLWFRMLDGFWMVVLALLLLSLSMM